MKLAPLSPTKLRNLVRSPLSSSSAPASEPTLVRHAAGPSPEPEHQHDTEHGNAPPVQKTCTDDTLPAADQSGSVVVLSTNENRSAAAAVPGDATASLTTEFENLMDSRAVPEDVRQKLRGLDFNLKQNLVENGQQRAASPPLPPPPSPSRKPPQPISTDNPLKHSPSRKIFSPSMPWSPKRFRKPKTDVSLPPPKLSAAAACTSPAEYAQYVCVVKVTDLDVELVRELRLNLQGEEVKWSNSFLRSSGIDGLCRCLVEIMKVKFREESHDILFRELLTCLRILSSLELGQFHFATVAPVILPALADFLFSESQPAFFADRSLVILLFISFMRSATLESRERRAKLVLSYFEDPMKPASQLGPDFIEISHVRRPFKNWCLECDIVVTDAFWIFAHTDATIDIREDCASDEVFTSTEVKGSPSTKGLIVTTEWDTIEYLGNHMELLNLVLSSFKTPADRNKLREKLEISGFDDLIGDYLRTATRETSQHLRVNLEILVSNSVADGWDVSTMRYGNPEHSSDSRLNKSSTRLIPLSSSSREHSEMLPPVPVINLGTLISEELFSLPDFDLVGLNQSAPE
ncbi:armadillo-type protein [Limtongia smithiae]|uniref:armadillo-type protein n=1 Tax=Limtongia smithiae TaxID=1125753 RepID=UPI0034CE0093